MIWEKSMRTAMKVFDQMPVQPDLQGITHPDKIKKALPDEKI